MKVIERDWDWWAYFWRVIHRQTIKGIDKWDKDVTRFIIEVLGCKKGEKILDLGCGSGEHTRFLAKRGLKCIGIDIAPSLIRYAKKKIREKRAKVEYIVKDMREINYKDEFDYCIMISGTFGFFSDVQNYMLLAKIKKALKPKGKLLFDIKNARYPRIDRRSWMYINNGYLLSESNFDPGSHSEGGNYIFIDKSGRINIMSEGLKKETSRLYTLSEIKSMLRKAGLKFMSAYAGYRIPPVRHQSSHKHNILLVTQKLL